MGQQASPGSSNAAATATVDPATVDLTAGPKASPWDNALFAAGWWLVIPFIVFDAILTVRAAFQVSLPGHSTAAGLAQLLVSEVIFWLVAAFTLGYGYRWLRGPNGMVKGVLLALVAITAHAATALIQLWLGQRSGSPWQAVSLQGWLLLLFLAGLGAHIDAETLRQHGLDSSKLPKAYQVERVQFVVTYVAPLVVAVLGIVQLVRSGQVQEAVKQALESASKLPLSGG